MFSYILPLVFIAAGIAFAVFWIWVILRVLYAILKGIATFIAQLKKTPEALRSVFIFIKQYPSVVGIVGVNLIPLWGVIWYDWKPLALLFTYWMQTGIIGFFAWLKIKKVAKLSQPERNIRVIAFQVRRSRARPVAEILEEFRGVYLMGMVTSLIFIILYNGYAEAGALNSNIWRNSVYLWYPALSESAVAITLGSLAFFINHTYSYFFNFIGKKEFLRSDLALELEAPIERVGTIWGAVFMAISVLGFIPNLGAILVTFVILKTMFDIYAHLKEHGRHFWWQYRG